MSIIIFSRPIHTGKTTELTEWCKQQKNIAGILMPDINGKRNIIDIKSKQSFTIECDCHLTTSEALQNIGSYHFYNTGFDKANSILIKALLLKPEWLVIDEVGKLELMKKGFYNPIKKILESNEYKTPERNLLLVIRDNLYEKAISFFELRDHTKISSLH